MSTADAQPGRRDGTTRRRIGLVLVAAIVVAAAGIGVTGLVQAATGHRRPPVPHDSGVEGKSGVRVTRVSLAADGGLVDVRYIVLDPVRASRATGDTDDPPVISNDRTHGRLDRVAAMRESHELRPGQTYYLIYLNTGGDVERGDTIDLDIAGTTLAGVPVE